MKRMSKKAQEMSISTLVIIVIAIVVLVLVVIGFTMGWQNLLAKFNIFTPTAGVADVVTSCKISVSTGSTVDFCQKFTKVKLANAETAYYSCNAQAVKDALGNEGVTPLNCGKDDEKKFCESLKQVDKKLTINEKTCTYTLAVAADPNAQPPVEAKSEGCTCN